MTRQTTLGNKVSCSGVGLHSGKDVQLTLYPAAADHGIVFKRLDVEAKHSRVPARYDLVCDTRLGTTLRNKHGVTVSTVEHLMAALWGAGIDNAVVEIDGPEVPIMDGSSEPFLFMIECAGLTRLAESRRILRILKPIEVTDGESFARIEPNLEGDEGCIMGIEIAFDHKVIDRQASHYDFREITFKQTLARARTFGFEHEVAMLRANGLALGGSLDNAIVVGKDRVLNEEGLRYNDEFVRHKALDCLGDLYLAGHRIDGRLTFVRPGHAINNQLLRALLADESAWRLVRAGAVTPAFSNAEASVPAYA